MPLKYRLPLVFFFTFLFLVFSVDATHGPSSVHARRAFALKKKPHRQLGISDPLNVNSVLGNLVGSGTTPTPGPSSSSTTSSGATSPPTTNPSTLPTNSDPPSTSSPTTTTPSSSDTSSTTPPPSTSTPTPTSSSLPTTDTSTSPTTSTTNPGSSSPSPSPSTDTPTSTPSTTSPTSSSPSPSSSTTPTCLLDLLGNCIPPTSSPAVSSTSGTPVTTSTSTTPTTSLSSSPSSSPADSPTSPPQQTTPTLSNPPTSSSGTPTSTLDCPLGVVVGGVCVLPSSPGTSTPPASVSSPSEPPPSTSPLSTAPDPGQPSSLPSSTTPNSGSSPSPSPSPTPTSSPPVDPCGPAGIALGLCSSNSSPPVSTPPSTSTPPASPSPNPSESSSQSAPSLSSLPSPSVPSFSSSPSQSAPSLSSSPSQSVDPCGPLGIALGLCTPSVVSSPTTTPQSPSQSTDPCGTLGIALGLCSSSSSPPVSISNLPSTPVSGTVPPSGTLSGTLSRPSPSSDQSSPGVPTVSSGSLNSSTSQSGPSSTPVIAFPSGTNSSFSSTPALSLTPTNGRPLPSFTPPPQSQLSYITDTSLLLGSSVSSSLPGTLSDPDAPTLSLATPSNSPPTTTPVVLPANLPSRIYPSPPLDTSNLSGYSLVSVLFLPVLSWSFVAQSSQSEGQLFSWFPYIVEVALGLTSDQVKTFALQVYVPGDYTGPADVDLLLTTYLLYIPTDQVPVLENEIRVASSAFYTALPQPYAELAIQVDPAFAVNSVQDPNVVPGTTSSLASSGNKSRTDAIIGVASALGGLALGVLGVLIYRSVKRSRDLRHRRLADPNAQNDPYPDRTGRDFDQDSIGGQRRRSFYFAEDSLRGQQAVQQAAVPVAQPQGQPVSQVEYSYRTSPDGVRERRAPVVTGAISAPILTQSSLNW